MVKYFILIFPPVCGIFSAYSLYVGFETGTIYNLFSGEYSPESSRKCSVDDSPIFYWLNMAAFFMSLIFSPWITIFMHKKFSKVNNP